MPVPMDSSCERPTALPLTKDYAVIPDRASESWLTVRSSFLPFIITKYHKLFLHPGVYPEQSVPSNICHTLIMFMFISHLGMISPLARRCVPNCRFYYYRVFSGRTGKKNAKQK